LLLSVANGWLKRDMLIIAGKRLASSLGKKSKKRIFTVWLRTVLL